MKRRGDVWRDKSDGGALGSDALALLPSEVTTGELSLGRTDSSLGRFGAHGLDVFTFHGPVSKITASTAPARGLFEPQPVDHPATPKFTAPAHPPSLHHLLWRAESSPKSTLDPLSLNMLSRLIFFWLIPLSAGAQNTPGKPTYIPPMDLPC